MFNRNATHTCVPHDVVHKMFFSSERLFTYITSVRGFARVFSDVVDHVFFASERFGAILTSETNFELSGASTWNVLKCENEKKTYMAFRQCDFWRECPSVPCAQTTFDTSYRNKVYPARVVSYAYLLSKIYFIFNKRKSARKFSLQ